MLKADKNVECIECYENCSSLSGIGDKLWCHLFFCDVYRIPTHAEQYINQVKQAEKDKPLTEESTSALWDIIRKQKEQIKLLREQVDSTNLYVKELGKKSDRHSKSYPQGEY